MTFSIILTKNLSFKIPATAIEAYFRSGQVNKRLYLPDMVRKGIRTGPRRVKTPQELKMGGNTIPHFLNKRGGGESCVLVKQNTGLFLKLRDGSEEGEGKILNNANILPNFWIKKLQIIIKNVLIYRQLYNLTSISQRHSCVGQYNNNQTIYLLIV